MLQRREAGMLHVCTTTWCTAQLFAVVLSVSLDLSLTYQVLTLLLSLQSIPCSKILCSCFPTAATMNVTHTEMMLVPVPVPVPTGLGGGSSLLFCKIGTVLSIKPTCMCRTYTRTL